MNVHPAMFVSIPRCFEPMMVSREFNIEMQLTCPKPLGTSKATLRTPTCESRFRNIRIGRHRRVFVHIREEIRCHSREL